MPTTSTGCLKGRGEEGRGGFDFCECPALPYRMSEEESHVSLNVKGQVCPLPVLRVKKVIDTMESGEVLEVAATDPRAKGDIARFSERLGHELLKTRREGGVFYFYIRTG